MDGSKKLLILLLLISLTFTIILGSNIQTQWAQDSHWHLSLAKSLSSGGGYSFEGVVSPHGKYPPGLTLLMLPFQIVTQNIQLSGLLMVGLISLLSIVLVYKIGSISDKRIGLLAAAFLVFHNLFVFNSVSIMTEVPFMLFSLAAIYSFVKGFEDNFMFLPSLVCFSMASLIRYDGLLLTIVFMILIWRNRNRIKEIKLVYPFIGTIFTGLLLGGWFIRNWIVLGSPLVSDYTRELTGISVMKYISFLFLFPQIGILFSVLVSIGLYFFIKEGNKKLEPYLIWLVVYMFLHMYWSTRVLRFYVEVLGIFCIFAAYGAFGIIDKFEFNKNNTRRFIIAIMAIFIVSQSLMFFVIPQGVSGVETLNRYNSVEDVSDYANENLPDNIVYVVSDIPVYNLYLNKTTVRGYGGILNLVKNNTKFYILTDSLHLWKTWPFMEGKNGTIKLPISKKEGFENGKDGSTSNMIIKEVNILLEVDTIFYSEYKNQEAMIFEITNISLNETNIPRKKPMPDIMNR